MITRSFERATHQPLCAFLISVALIISGCSHTLEVKNLGMYKPAFVDSPALSSKLGLVPSTNTTAEEKLLLSIANNLKKNGFRVTYPFFPKEENRKSVDFIVKVTTSSRFRGSGWNFLINFPGFLIWTPAWHGYNYGALFEFDVDITDTSNDQSLPRLDIPVDLDIRHAAINRTWTEISWFEWGAIALIGGIVFTRYDGSVTPILVDAVENKIGDYVASKISRAVIAARASVPQLPTPVVEVPSAIVQPPMVEKPAEEMVVAKREPLPTAPAAPKAAISSQVIDSAAKEPGQ